MIYIFVFLLQYFQFLIFSMLWLLPYIYSIVMGHLDTNNFYFIFFYFSDFTLLFFYFLLKTMKKAHNKEVTCQVTWCDVISLELDGRVWKMTSGHLEYTWWPWVGHKCQDRWRWTLFYFLFSFLFYFSFHFLFIFFFIFLFLEQLGLGFISHAVTSVTNWWRSHKTDHKTWENGVEGTRIKWHHTAWTTHAGLM